MLKQNLPLNDLLWDVIRFLVLLDYWVQICESRILLKPVLDNMRDVAFYSVSHEQTQSNRICCRFTLFLKDPLFGLHVFAKDNCS